MPDLQIQDTQRQTSHPDSLEFWAFQVHDPWIFELRRHSKASPITSLSLHRSLIGASDEQHRSRIVCILTDQILKRYSTFSLQWPEDKDSEVTVTSVSDEGMIVIATGIMSGHMMDDDAWVSESEDEDLLRDLQPRARPRVCTPFCSSPLD
jgi:hypothetical protein